MGQTEEVRLTKLSHGAGCACKIGADDVAGIRELLPPTADPDLLVGLEPADDAAVYRLSDGLALVQTIDFFTPIVDDPYDFGRIAAANAISDVYAMGATPVIALNVVAYSLERLGRGPLEQILRGGAEVATAAGVSVAGGHSIDDPEPKYGMAVTGIANPQRILTKAGARPGDRIHLTKPVGGSLIATAAKRGRAPHGSVDAMVEVMTELNREASERAIASGAMAMTDVTGYGLLGHLQEICDASGVGAQIEAAAAPAIEGALELATRREFQSGGSRRNEEAAAAYTVWDYAVPEERRVLLTDAMTSGGLLVAVPGSAAGAPGVEIGSFTAEPDWIRVS
jgi:selenide,water dikinase